MFGDGYFWHSCPVHRIFPPSNHDSWVAELDKNVSRDRFRQLLAIGWGMSALLGA